MNIMAKKKATESNGLTAKQKAELLAITSVAINEMNIVFKEKGLVSAEEYARLSPDEQAAAYKSLYDIFNITSMAIVTMYPKLADVEEMA